MGKPKYDGVVEGVRYKPNGEVDWVRAYERRGAVFSDDVLISRQALLQKLKSGKKFVVGRRIADLGASFDVSAPLRVSNSGGKEFLVADDHATDQDHLPGVPMI